MMSWIVMLLLLQTAAPQSPPPRPTLPTRPVEKHIRIEGKVLSNTTGEVLPGARVHIENTKSPGTLLSSSWVDANGHFELSEIPDGTFRLFAEGPGYIPLRVEGRKFTDGIPLSLDKGQEVHDMVLRLLPASIITGRVLDSNGDPMEGASVTPFRYTYDDLGERTAVEAGYIGITAKTTDDRGVFRFNDLPPGEYGFKVESDHFALNPRAWASVRRNRPASAPVELPPIPFFSFYYSNSSDLLHAETVQVESGSDIHLKDIRTPNLTGGKLSIRVTADDGSGGTARILLQLKIRPKGAPVFEGLDLVMTLDQPILVGNLPVGSYEVAVVPPSPAAPGLTGFTSFEMGTNDLEVTIKLPRPANLTLHAVKEAKAGLPPEPQPGLRLQFIDAGSHFDQSRNTVPLSAASTASFAATVSSMTAGSGLSYAFGVARILSTPTGADGISSIPAFTPGQFRVGVAGIPEGMVLVSMKVGNRDVLREGLDIASGDDQRLEVVLGESPGVVHGVLSNRAGNKVPGGIVVLIPDDRSLRTMYALAFSDKNGEYEFHASPGAYHLFAWTELDGAAYRNSDFMRKYEEKGAPVQLERGSQAILKLTILDDIPPER
jgi:hypothetical protein